MTHLVALFLLVILTGSVTAPVLAQEIPSRVREVSASIMMFCTRLEMHGLFRSVNAQGERTIQPGIETIQTCSNAFQISESRVLSAAHVNNDVATLLTQHFAHKLAVLQRHGFAPGYTPEKIDRVTLERFLVSSSGHRFYGPQEEYHASWSGELEGKTVRSFLESLVSQNVAAPQTMSAMTILATDPDRDLMLLSISPTHEQKAYASLLPGAGSIGTNVWGVAALLPWNEKGELNLVIDAGTVHQLTIESALRESIEINMEQPTMGGYSGGFVVDDSGRLIGVTQASTALEHAWSFDLPHPCSSILPCRRAVVPMDSVHEFLKIHGY